jgi:anaerobic ribonucleoside-triphosphate reductase activating protein
MISKNLIRGESLNIAAYHYPVSTLGPGKRFVLWVQGCPFNCKSCISPDYIPFDENTRISIEGLANYISEIDGIDGITLSGGEPFSQAKNLTKLIKMLKGLNPKLNFICFTGYSFGALKSKAQKELLNVLDLVITELFIEELNSENGLRGSDNQNFIFLTDKLVRFKDEIENGKKKTETFIFKKNIVQVGIMSKSERSFHDSFLQIINSL